MTDPRWERVEDLFHEARRRGEAEAELYLKRECAGDDRMLAAVKRMLTASLEADHVFERTVPIAAALAPVLAPELAAPPAPASPFIGTLLGAWQIDRHLAAGGMGDVFAAHRADAQYHQQAAVKLLRRGFDTPDLRRRFQTEREILATLDHPSIARLLDGGITPDGLPYLVMEFVEGTELDHYCNHMRLGIPDRLRLFRQVCSAVRHAHSQLVVHRDLKPSNILVTASGEVKLLDFGIGKFLDDADSAQTSATNVLLTPRYASPEQVLGRAVTTRSDVYSLGVLLFELLCGRSPYSSTQRTVAEWFDAIQREQPPALRHATANETLRRGFSPDLELIVAKALRKDPAERYFSVEQLEADIAAYLDGRPILARPQTTLYRVSKFVRRHRAAVAASSLALLALAASLAVALYQGRVAERERQLAVQRFQQARELAHLTLFDLFDVIKDIPGSTPAQQLLISRSVQHYEKLARQASGDPVLLAEVVSGYTRLGDLAGNPYTTNLGDSKRAMDTYQKAIELLQPIPEGSGPVPLELARATLFHSRGEVTGLSGDQKKAVAELQHSVRLLEALKLKAPADPDVDLELASALGSLGDHLGGIGTGEIVDRPATLRTFMRELEISKALADRPGLDSARAERARRGVAVSTMKLGNSTLGFEQYEQALRWYSESDQAMERLSPAERDSTTNQRLRSMILKGKALALTYLNRPKEAVAPLSGAVSILRSLLRRDTDNQQFEYGLAMVLKLRGDAFDQSGDPSSALEDYREAERHTASLAGRDAANAVIQSRLADLRELIKTYQAR